MLLGLSPGKEGAGEGRRGEREKARGGGEREEQRGEEGKAEEVSRGEGRGGSVK